MQGDLKGKVYSKSWAFTPKQPNLIQNYRVASQSLSMDERDRLWEEQDMKYSGKDYIPELQASETMRPE